MKHKFVLEVQLARYDADHRWIRVDWWHSLPPAIDVLRRYLAVRDDLGSCVFRSARIRYRGLTLRKELSR